MSQLQVSEYHDITYSIEDLRKRAREYVQRFSPSNSQLKRCYNSFLNELCIGLESHSRDNCSWNPEKCSLMMLDCYIDCIPNGKEKGVFYAVDFGGINIRTIRCALDGRGKSKVKSLKYNIKESKLGTKFPKGLLDKNATASLLFDDIAAAVNQHVQREGDSQIEDLGIGLTFSFDINQKSLTSAILMYWNKDFETGIESNDPVIGQDVCVLLNKAFERRKMNARVSAVLNETVGAMLSGTYCKRPEHPRCMVSLILGRRVNGAYVQPDAKNYGYNGIVLNTEMGEFNKDLPRNEIDHEIDFNSPDYGRYRFEKMCSEIYIPELIRLVILRVFQNLAPQRAWIPNSLTAEGCGAVLNDEAPFLITSEVFNDLWDWATTSDELPLLHELVSAVFHRSAAVSAVAIAAMSKSNGHLQPAMGGLTCGIDGALYVRSPIYQEAIRKYLEVILTKSAADLINIVISEDGSGKGAAILASTL